MMVDLCTVCVCVVVVAITYKLCDLLVRAVYLPKRDTAEKYVLITGCDTGFGRALVERLDTSARCKVIAGCLLDSSIEQIRSTCSARVHAIQLDIASDDSVAQAYTEVTTDVLPHGTGLWAVVNNAGITGLMGPLEWLGTAELQRVININVLGTVRVITTFLPLLKQLPAARGASAGRGAGGGRVVNMASCLGRFAPPFSIPYTLTKRAIESLSDSLRLELYQFGITVHVLEPGSHNTALANRSTVHQATWGSWRNTPAELQQQYGEHYVHKLLRVSDLGLKLTTNHSLDPVLDSYTHALFGRYPRCRYLIGLDARVYTVLGMLPEWLSDACFTVPRCIPVPACMQSNHQDS